MRTPRPCGEKVQPQVAEITVEVPPQYRRSGYYKRSLGPAGDAAHQDRVVGRASRSRSRAASSGNQAFPAIGRCSVP